MLTSALGQSLINHIRKNFTLLSFFLEGLHYFHKKKKKKKKILKPIPLKQ